MGQDDLQDYADKLYDLHKETMQRAHNLSVINFVLSLLGLGVTAGSISIRPESDVGGLSVSSSGDYMLLIIASLVAVTYTYIAGLTIHADRLFRSAMKLFATAAPPSLPYELLRYPDLGLALTTPPLAHTLKGKPSLFFWLSGALVVVATLVVPFGSIASLSYRLYGTDVAWPMKALVGFLDITMAAAAHRLIVYFIRNPIRLSMAERPAQQ